MLRALVIGPEDVWRAVVDAPGCNTHEGSIASEQALFVRAFCLMPGRAGHGWRQWQEWQVFLFFFASHRL
jgi:hypothetical protein